MFKKKIVKVLTTAALLGSCALPVYAGTTFSDIDGSFAKDAIQKLADAGILNGNGDGKFDPQGKIERQDFAIILAKALKLDTTTAPSTATFSDVAPTDYSFKYVEAAAKAGLIKGTGDGKFGEGGDLSRQDMAALFVRALGVDTTGKGKELSFSDASSIADYAKDAVAAAVGLGLITGNPDGTFNPTGNAERQAVALVASKFLKAADERKNQIPTPPAPPAQPEKPVPAPVTNSNTGGGGSGSGRTPVVAPTITSLTPSSGPTMGDTVAITGTGLTGTTAVKFGEVAATSFTVVSDTQITAVAPAGNAGVVDVSVTTPNGTVRKTAGYTYIAAPTITSFTPSSGSTTGDTVTITGTGLRGATDVKFGGVSASFTVDSDTQITTKAPGGTIGDTVTVSVTTPYGTANSVNGYTYVVVPTITSITPSIGLIGSDNIVTITGTGLTGATVVKFGEIEVNATDFAINPDGTQITVTVPAVPGVGTVNVSVTTPNGTATVANGYTYVMQPL